MYNLNEETKKQENETGVSSGFFKFSEGQNKLRLLSRPVLSVGEYQGRQTVKYVCFILDYKDNQVKSAFLPKKIITDVGSYQMNEEYTFDDFPMPYDITVVATGAGTKEVKYTVQPAKKETELSEEILEQLRKKGSIEDFASKIESKNKKSTPSAVDEEVVEDLPIIDTEEDIKPEDLPF